MKSEDKEFCLKGGLAMILLGVAVFVFGLSFIALMLDAPAAAVAQFDRGVRIIALVALVSGLLATLVGMLWPVKKVGAQP